MNSALGELTLQSLVNEFGVLVEKKIDLVLKDPPVILTHRVRC